MHDFGRVVRAIEGRKASRPYTAHLNFTYIIGACKGHTASTTGCGLTTVNETEQMIAEVVQLEKDRVVPSSRVFWDVHSPTPRELAIEVANYTRLGSHVRTVVLEENGNTHDLARALGHASLNNAYQRLGEAIVPIAGYPDMMQAYQQMDRWGGRDEPITNSWSQGQPPASSRNQNKNLEKSPSYRESARGGH